MEQLREAILDKWLAGYPVWLTDCLMCAMIAAVAVAVYYITKLFLIAIERAVASSKTTWDDHLLNTAMLTAVAQLAPAVAVKYMLPGLFESSQFAHLWLSKLTSLYILATAVRIITIFLGNMYTALSLRENTKAYAVKGIFQMLKLIAIALGAIVAISIIIGREPVVILTTIGASAAVLMLVFRDTILGLVASIQLSANKMLHRGDWIVAERHNANGEVIDVSLTTVKVRNWDNSISTIPPYSLVSDSFRNYEAMRYSGGRRCERSIPIDLSSVRHYSHVELESLAADGFIKETDINTARHTVNLTLLRKWIEHLLDTDPRINSDMLHMVRQLEPTATGLPLQLYFFTRTVEWQRYENDICDIFDIIYATINRFGLSVFQSPTGSSITKLTEKNPAN